MSHAPSGADDRSCRRIVRKKGSFRLTGGMFEGRPHRRWGNDECWSAKYHLSNAAGRGVFGISSARSILPYALKRTAAADDLPAQVPHSGRLDDADMVLQENKAVNLSLAAPKISGVLIRPGKVFSLWHLVGKTSASKRYRKGSMIRQGKTDRGIGGGLRGICTYCRHRVPFVTAPGTGRKKSPSGAGRGAIRRSKKSFTFPASRIRA